MQVTVSSKVQDNVYRNTEGVTLAASHWWISIYCSYSWMNILNCNILLLKYASPPFLMTYNNFTF